MAFSQIQNQTSFVPVGGVHPPPAGYAPSSSSFTFVTPSAPSLDKMDRISGYETTTFQGIPAPPPSYFETSLSSPPSVRPQIAHLPNLTEEQVRESLSNFVSEHCCYGKKPVQLMKIVSLEPACAYHYTIETYAEKRETAWATEPYDGQFVDGPAYGLAPTPWDIQIYNTIPRYEDGQIFSPVPHTSSIKQCHKCVGLGRRPCENCMSMGKVQCTFCQSVSTDHHHTNHNNQNRLNYHQHNQHVTRQNSNPQCTTCNHCNGMGWKTCSKCNGIGQKICESCDGRGQLKCFIKLTVTMKNHLGDFLVEPSNRSFLPQNLLKNASGTVIYEEDAPKIWPISGFPIIPVVDASRLLIQQHNCAFQNERVHCQRQRVRTIPVTEAICVYKNEEAKFYVYGLQNQIYFPDYFQKCCGCCVLM